jgi:hypothetical protein
MNPPAAPSSRYPLRERVALALSASAVAVALWSALCTTPRFDWNAARLMPAFVLAAGERIYFPPGAGPALGWIYGPVMPAVMTPAALLPTITSAMLAAALINAAFLLGPLLLGVNAVARRAGRAGRERAWLLVACAGGALAVPWIANALVFITADNFLVGLALASCVCLAHAGDSARGRWCAALLAALAVWTKQLAIGVPAAQVLWLVWSAGPRAAGRHAGRLLVAGVALAAVAVAIFGFEELRFNLWTVPSHHPLKGGGEFWFAQLGALALACVPVAGALGVLSVRLTGLSPAATLLAVVAIGQLPLGALGASKIGGGENSFHAIYYFTAAAGLQLASSGAAVATWLRHRVVAVGLVAALAGLFTVARQTEWRLTPAVQLEASRAMAAEHRGEILFPRNPLVTWWTEGKVYHLEYGYLDQALAGFPPTPARLAAWLPANLRYVVYQDDGVDHPFVRLLPGFERAVRGPGFVVHIAPAAARDQ